MVRARRGYGGAMSRVTVLGSVNMDQFFEVTELPARGQTILASATHTEPGGKGGNQAVAAARAGADVRLVAAIGTDAHGQRLREHLLDNNVRVDGLTELPLPSGTAAIVVSAAAENMIVVAPGANAHLTVNSSTARAAISGCDVLLAQLEIPLPTVLAAARQARADGATVMVNASPAGGDPDLLAQLAAVTDVVVVNRTEATEWHWPVPHLVITLGADGATHRCSGGERHVPAPAVEPVDSTGAGDVFAGVLAAAWTGDPDSALHRAVTAGALATLIPGAGDCAPSAEAVTDALR